MEKSSKPSQNKKDKEGRKSKEGSKLRRNIVRIVIKEREKMKKKEEKNPMRFVFLKIC